jgi:hypothetical protein
MFKKLPENIRLIINSVSPLIVVLVLFVVVGQFAFGKISEVRNKITKSQKDQAILVQKFDLIKTLGETAASSVAAVSNALPEANPSLTVISQMKILAAQNGIVIANTKGGAEVKDNSGLSRVDITFDVIGPRAQIITLTKSISQIAPITLVDKIKITESAGAARATIATRSFWAPFPTKLPALTEAITDLTADEKKTLGVVTGLTQPEFSEVTASDTAPRPDPFTQ